MGAGVDETREEKTSLSDRLKKRHHRDFFNLGKGNIVQRIKQALVNFLKAEDGPTAVEYAVMLALIIVVCIAGVIALGSNSANSTNTFNLTVQTVDTTGT